MPWLARENGWGYSRILVELKKLGIGTVSRSTVINIFREAGIDPGPKRVVGSWSEFLTRHAASLWASDFLTLKTWTARGIVDLPVLFFIHPGTRKSIHRRRERESRRGLDEAVSEECDAADVHRRYDHSRS